MWANFLSKFHEQKQGADINVESDIYLYWGLLRNVSGWFKQPPALFARSEIGESASLSVFEAEVFAVVAHDPNSWVSFHVFDNENIDVLISRQTDISLKCAKKSSNGILQKILSCCTIFWPIFIATFLQNCNNMEFWHIKMLTRILHRHWKSILIFHVLFQKYLTILAI